MPPAQFYNWWEVRIIAIYVYDTIKLRSLKF
jgi:optic atrophy 3 protein